MLLLCFGNLYHASPLQIIVKFFQAALAATGWSTHFILSTKQAAFEDLNIREEYSTEENLDQREKKDVSDSLGLMDFAVGLVDSVFHLPDRQVKFLGKIAEEIQITDEVL